MKKKGTLFFSIGFLLMLNHVDVNAILKVPTPTEIEQKKKTKEQNQKNRLSAYATVENIN